MNTKNFIKGIDEVISGLQTIKSAFDEAEEVVTGGFITEDTTEEEEILEIPKAEEPKETKKKSTKKTVETPVVSDDEDLEERLNAMKYNELKKYASSLGIDAKGTRDTIIAKILNKDTTEEPEAEVEEPKKEEKSKVTPITKGKKKEPKEDEFDAQAKEVLESTDADDVIEALEDVGVKATKNNVAEKLAYALREGLIELGEDDEETEDETEDTEEVIDGNTYFSEYDEHGVNNPENVEGDRKDAIIKLQEQKLQEIEDEKLTLDDIIDFLSDNVTEEEANNIDTDDEECLIGNYLELMKRFVDDDGELHTPNDPYTINDAYYCCGHKLIEKDGKFVCEVCGEEYDTE